MTKKGQSKNRKKEQTYLPVIMEISPNEWAYYKQIKNERKKHRQVFEIKAIIIIMYTCMTKHWVGEKHRWNAIK